MAEFTVKTQSSCQIIDITELVNAHIPASLKCGICHIFCPHTTAAITVNENADPDVKHDMLMKLDQLIAYKESYYLHAEGNSAAHLKASILGFSQAVPVINGALDLGVWQGIYFCEFFGPRTRTVKLLFTTAEE